MRGIKTMRQDFRATRSNGNSKVSEGSRARYYTEMAQIFEIDPKETRKHQERVKLFAERDRVREQMAAARAQMSADD